MRLKDRVVLVTGGGQGIGRAISQAYAREGASVIIADIDKEAGLENQALISNTGGEAVFVETDIAKESSVANLIHQINAHFGRLNILINNAGLSYKGNMLLDPLENWDRVIGTNLRGTYLCVKLTAPYLMKEQGSSIINIASTRALMSEPDSEAYAASKGGILALTHALAVSLGPKIRVNAISPRWIEVQDWQKSNQAASPIHSESDNSQHPVGRVGKPQDIAEACMFLTSAEAGFITGTNLVIDGGMTIKMIYQE